jgi:ADP-ribose pyrophosphatase
MVDCGEKVSATVKREFMEEAMNGLEKSDEEKQKVIKQLESLFNQEVVVSF